MPDEERTETEETEEESSEKRRKAPSGLRGIRKKTREKLIRVAELIAQGVPVREALRQVGLGGEAYTKYKSIIKRLVKQIRGVEEQVKPVGPPETPLLEQTLSEIQEELPPGELGESIKMLRQTIAFFDEVERLKHSLARKLGAIPSGPIGPPIPQQQQKEESVEETSNWEKIMGILQKMEEKAKKFLEARGYKVLPPGSVSNVEEAKKLLEQMGYSVSKSCIPKEEIKKYLDEAYKKGFDDGYRKAKEEFSDVEKTLKEKQLDIAKSVLEKIADRVTWPFSLLLARYFGIDISNTTAVGVMPSGAQPYGSGYEQLIRELEEGEGEGAKEGGPAEEEVEGAG